MGNNNYLSLINFEIKLDRQKLFFINEHDVLGSIFFLKNSRFIKTSDLNLQHRVHLFLKRVPDDEVLH